MPAAAMSSSCAFHAFGDALDYALANAPWRAAEASSKEAAESAASDESLLAAYRGGDAQAFRALYLRYRGKLHRYLLRLAANEHEAEEVFQEVWISVIRDHQCEPGRPFAGWLFAVAHRRAADRWRQLERHAPDFIHRVESDEKVEDDLPVAGRTPELDAGNAALGTALLEAIRQLPLPQREAFLLRAEAGFGAEAIAEATGVSFETAKSRLRYAQNRLRKALEDWR